MSGKQGNLKAGEDTAVTAAELNWCRLFWHSVDDDGQSKDVGKIGGKTGWWCPSFVQLPFLAFLLGHVVTAGRRRRLGRRDKSAQFKRVTRCVIDELETVATEQNATKPPRHQNNHVLDV